MVKRLIDEQGLESVDEKLALLFRAAAPFEADPFRKRRVLVTLSRVPTRHAPRFWLRPAIISTLLISGTATAALGHRYVAQGASVLGFATPAVTSAPIKAPVAKRLPVASHAEMHSALEANDDPVDTASDAAEAAPSAAHLAPKSGTHARAESGEDATNVAQAIQALRTERDPSRAQSLLNDYLKAHPNGVLSEDAWALSIEAASAQHDPRAADYARRYLAKFPHGKYRGLATRAVAQQH